MSACKCQACVECCNNYPGWCTPDEAEALIKIGYGGRLMNDWWVDDPDDVQLLCPAIEGLCGGRAEESIHPERGRCTFLTDDNLCEVHDLAKPIECRLTMGCGEINYKREQIKEMWNNERGRALVAKWESLQ